MAHDSFQGGERDQTQSWKLYVIRFCSDRIKKEENQSITLDKSHLSLHYFSLYFETEKNALVNSVFFLNTHEIVISVKWNVSDLK